MRWNDDDASDRREADDAQPLDPIALTLAVWLGVIVIVTGLVRMSENASMQASLAQAAGRPGVAADDIGPLSARMIAIGG